MAFSIMAPGRMDGRLRAVIKHSLATLLATTALGVVAAHAVDGTWTGATTDWTAPTNWSILTVPDGTATFSNTGSAAVDTTTAPSPSARSCSTAPLRPIRSPSVSRSSSTEQASSTTQAIPRISQSPPATIWCFSKAALRAAAPAQ
ncbi:hypothetical protein ACFPFP_32265 [Bradyrhizobium sp. GCM10023182]|uniref:Uncharacterized protein n=1 Tax=Bradyrhizobium zhengyangense TaxID=2911009 RepID=A0ABS9LXS5_9BRAD|nr:hypothetical protein [Bradyrhizobium zhengyangense]MCG2671614.1 hypothetical protein [Bradyrhizobium zhengyangense]